ncbi:DNA polymerase III subunit chi [Allopusillimonas soli]|uniref:DNA polymerase III subunit chi n=1 Tax=Allopusillimonas soli TaxID=659016 RepID=A0A853FEM0_9BURK|nr:DNA polymerase III subunit chi [Allopusillimonas soli]NYT38339.1 DNA polymerase III subunit chi [Allopusillimonas soli]TEA72091.1 DNA polymerase III subunit chi [Allopusillimonas soli]
MATRVDFAFGASDRLRMACEVVRKHHAAGRRVVVYTRDMQHLVRFDRLLWGFDATAFVPHVMADDPLAQDTPVLLATSLASLPAAGSSLDAKPDGGGPPAEQEPFSPKPVDTTDSWWLLNLDHDCPPEAPVFGRILEIVSNQEDDRQQARARWRQYHASGHALHAHDVSGRQP